ncbi:MAG: hypothetical protein J1F64_10530 [Oscillospiraceae bacterium]|nr:hypothetical protein [Oscillospiraceae bacterium]
MRMRNFYRIAAGAAVVLSAVSLIPFLIISLYNFPVSDDFGYGAPVYYSLKSGTGIWGVFGAIAENLRYTYRNWQGTFSSVILFSVQPASFADGLYVITPFVMLAAIISPIFTALGAIRVSDRAGRLFIGAMIAFISVQYLPSIADGIFWWNGAVHYMIFWGASVIVTILQIRLSYTGRNGPAFCAGSILGCLLAFFVGGGNYSCALAFAAVSFIITVFAAATKQKRHIIIANILMTVFAAGGLIISMAAPGNAVRQAEFEQPGAISAIIMSLRQAFSAVCGFTDIKVIGAVLLCAPVFVRSVRETGFKFRYPLIVLLISFFVFAAMYVPPIYAMGTADALRMKNMFWLAYLFFMFGSIFYIAGWISVKADMANTRRMTYILNAVCIVGAVLFFASAAGRITSSNAYLSYSDLRGGAAGRYSQVRKEREKIYEDKSVPFPRFSPVTEFPGSFHDPGPSQFLTWTPDVILDGTPVRLLCYHACGGEVTYVGLQSALDMFERKGEAELSDFSRTFRIGREECVPLRELTDMLGFEIDYDLHYDTLTIKTR